MLFRSELGYVTTAEAMQPRLERALADHSGVVFVARRNDECIGFCHVHLATESILSDPAAEIGSLVVASGHRGEGTGASLVEYALNWARDRGAVRARVRTNVVRDGAMRFYERNGWQAAKRQQVYVFDLQLVEPNRPNTA